MVRRKAIWGGGRSIADCDPSQKLIWDRAGKFTFNEIVKATEDFDDMYCIGKGGFGSVYRAELEGGQTVAVKRLEISGDYPAERWRSFESEVRVLTEARHRNIVRLHGSCSTKGSMYLVYEYMERGSLGKVLYGEAEEMGWPERLRVVRGVAHAVAYLHHDCNPAVVHRDISVNNVLLEAGFEPRVADFGTARLLNPDSSNWTAVAGSYGYMAPVTVISVVSPSMVDHPFELSPTERLALSERS
ncbi:hypothetical protein MRB53_015838 [Persea americana]|uniref:Uncharacterized protein n=1 Tax=Persea americana TaxID=3435 RepID=A0ACC2M0C1_PERAE|nr:hypothetical protein MRB53_015838 [Persea americana]